MTREWETYIKDQDKTEELRAVGSEMLENLCDWLSANYDPKRHDITTKSIARSIYKNTDCGAWIVFHYDRPAITIGSIIEGSDADGPQYRLDWPFTQIELDKTIELIERTAEDMWVEANDLPDMIEGNAIAKAEGK